MAVSNIKVLIPGELHKVWELVLDIENYADWRSDLSKTEGVAMDNEILKYRQRLKERAAQKPIWEKACLTIEEAAEYTGIGRTKLRALVRQKKCPFSMPTGNQILIVREKFDDYIKGRKRI